MLERALLISHVEPGECADRPVILFSSDPMDYVRCSLHIYQCLIRLPYARTGNRTERLADLEMTLKYPVLGKVQLPSNLMYLESS